MHDLDEADEVTVDDAAVRVVRTFGASRVEQPISLRAPHSSAEIPFGHVQRPTHANTSWDAARYALVVGVGVDEAISEGYHFNQPERILAGTAEVAPVVMVDNGAVVIESVKLADDRSGDVVVRFYEAHGSRAKATITLGFPVASHVVTDLLERPLDAAGVEISSSSEGIEVTLRPFQIVTLRLARA